MEEILFSTPTCTLNKEGGSEVKEGPMLLNGGDLTRSQSMALSIVTARRCMVVNEKGKCKIA